MVLYYFIGDRLPTNKAYGVQTVNMVSAFAKQVEDLRFLYVTGRGNLAQQDLETFYSISFPKNLHQIRIKIWDFISIFGGKERLERLGFRLEQILTSLAVKHVLSKVGGEESYAFTRSFSLFPSLLYRFGADRSCIEVHHLSSDPRIRDYQIKILRRARKIVVLTYQAKNYLIGEGIGESNILVAHDGVDIDRFSPLWDKKMQSRDELDLPKDVFIVSYIGRFRALGKEKGIDVIIRASRNVFKEHRNVLFMFVGGPIEAVPGYLNLITMLGLPREKFVFLDRRPHSEVPKFISASDLVVLPSPDEEFFSTFSSPLKLFEYMAVGRPIVASSLPAVSEIIKDGINGLLFVPGDPQSLAGTIIKVLSSPDLRGRLSRRAREYAKDFSWDKRAQKILDFMVQ